MSSLKITLTKSMIGFEKSQGLTARALGMKKVGTTVIRPDNPAVRGMLHKLRHAVAVEEITTDAPAQRPRTRYVGPEE
ncbi:MAG: 50S ribosomal protein L30 [Capsulimonadaceae bacterium]